MLILVAARKMFFWRIWRRTLQLSERRWCAAFGKLRRLDPGRPGRRRKVYCFQTASRGRWLGYDLVIRSMETGSGADLWRGRNAARAQRFFVTASPPLWPWPTVRSGSLLPASGSGRVGNSRKFWRRDMSYLSLSQILSPDERTLYVTLQDGRHRIVRSGNGKYRRVYSVLGFVNSFALSPSGQHARDGSRRALEAGKGAWLALRRTAAIFGSCMSQPDSTEKDIFGGDALAWTKDGKAILIRTALCEWRLISEGGSGEVYRTNHRGRFCSTIWT